MKHFIWDETDTEISITFLNKNFRKQNTDVYIAPRLLKANCNNHVICVDLLHEVDCYTYSKAESESGNLRVKLQKKDMFLWNRLECNKEDKKFLSKRRLNTRNVRDAMLSVQNNVKDRNRKGLKKKLLNDHMKLEKSVLSKKILKQEEMIKSISSEIRNFREESSIPENDIKLNEKLFFEAPRSIKFYETKLTPRMFHVPKRNSCSTMENEFIKKNSILYDDNTRTYNHKKGNSGAYRDLYTISSKRRKADKCFQRQDFGQSITLYTSCLDDINEISTSLRSQKEYLTILLSRATSYCETGMFDEAYRDWITAEKVINSDNAFLFNTTEHKRFVLFAIYINQVARKEEKVKAYTQEANTLGLLNLSN